MKILLKIYRFLLGYATISIHGGFPERFLNLCNREHIFLWDTLYESSTITAKIYCMDFYRLRKIRQKSGVKIKLLNKTGFLFSYKQNKKRKMLICGIALSLSFMYFLNLFVWCIDVSATETISRQELLLTTEKLGLEFGAFVPFIDENRINREAVNSFGGKVMWSAINIKGSKAITEVREHTSSENSKPVKKGPNNIVADFDGVIVSTEVYCGTGIAERGNAVKTGDLLVSGISENSDGSVNYHNADGKITAYRKINNEMSFDSTREVIKLSENKRNISVKFFSLTLPLKKNFRNDADISYTQYLNISSCILPFGYSASISTEKEDVETTVSSIVFDIDEFTAKEYTSFKNTLLLNSDYTISNKKDGLNIMAEYDCIDFIGKKTVIFQEN